jgi:hypothetical protein
MARESTRLWIRLGVQVRAWFCAKKRELRGPG